MEKLFPKMILNTNDLFGENPVDARSLYLHYFDGLPSEFYINGIDGEKACAAFQEKYAERIIRVYRHQWYNVEKKQVVFWRALVVLDSQIVAEFDETLCEIWHNDLEPEFLIEAAQLIAPFKQRERKKPLEINLVIRQRLNKTEDKGIVLLHGLPGTGKTTYLRYLIGGIKKRILFLSPAVTGDLMNPEFIELLTAHPNSVVIIEDAENVIMDRRNNPGSSVSHLLNISDGLLADFLSIQLVCTFNSPLTLVDGALLRKGRLIAKYEFGKLKIEQSQRLSNHLGFDTIITSPMTIAEIAGQNERQVEPDRMEVLGFRSHLQTN